MRNSRTRFSHQFGIHRLIAYTTGAKTIAIRISNTSGLSIRASAIAMELDTH